jgi:RNA polymerase sigma factor (TIGR02999 family)
MSASEPEVAQLLTRCASGDPHAADDLFTLVYDDLRMLAHRHLRREVAGHTLNTTALVHEVFLALVDPAPVGWRSRAHFLAVSSRAMRHILIDYARSRLTAKRGGATIRVPLREDLTLANGDEANSIDLLALEEALVELAKHEQRLGRVVECRFFGGMSVEETAEALGVGVRTVERDWTRAKAYLFERLVE